MYKHPYVHAYSLAACAGSVDGRHQAMALPSCPCHHPDTVCDWLGMAIRQTTCWSPPTAFQPPQVYLKRCLQVVDATKAGAFHPIIYAFIREAVAGPILWLLSYAVTGTG